MGYPSKNQEEGHTGADTLDFIDLKEFINRSAVLKKDIHQTSVNTSSLEKDLDEAETFPTVNTSFVQKWQTFLENHPQVEEKELYQMISSSDAGLTNDAVRREAVLAMRIARSKLTSVEAYKADLVASSAPKPARSIPVPSSSASTSGSLESVNNTSEGDDVILTISVYTGTKPAQIHPAHRQELEIKASEPLAALTEQLYCLSRRVAKEIASDSEKQIIESSSFLFIENVFYDDELDGVSPGRPSDIYYNAMKAGEFSVSAHLLASDPTNVQRMSLKSSKWLDLKIRLNTPYLFAHLGGCEHTFLITQIRSSNPIYDQHFLAPSRVSHGLRVRRRKCRICETYVGTKMLINDKLMPENPCIICDKCFEGFHGAEKSWYTDFEMVPYHHEI